MFSLFESNKFYGLNSTQATLAHIVSRSSMRGKKNGHNQPRYKCMYFYKLQTDSTNSMIPWRVVIANFGLSVDEKKNSRYFNIKDRVKEENRKIGINTVTSWVSQQQSVKLKCGSWKLIGNLRWTLLKSNFKEIIFCAIVIAIAYQLTCIEEKMNRIYDAHRFNELRPSLCISVRYYHIRL